jgi:2-keto-4-pentenoate hydratase/2-oxohepta-3-ene-1,7-dioic acid hydratase in catechol pathway
MSEGEAFSTAVWDGEADRWVPLRVAVETAGSDAGGLEEAVDDVLSLLGDPGLRSAAARVVEGVREIDLSATSALEPAVLPFAPRSLRAFSLFERHQVDAARGLVRRYMPRPARAAVSGFESLTRRTFPALKPKPLFYERPLFYMGNHLTIYPDGAAVPWPAYAEDIDYELELGFVLARPLRDASAAEGAEAIGGFFVVNDVSARDTQWREYRESVFGPVVKAKTFASAMSAEVVTADELLPRVEGLRGTVRVNGELWGEGSTSGMQHSPGDMVAYASEGEDLRAGEVFATGTLPGCCGLEVDRWIRPGDDVALEIEGVGTLRNQIGAR